MPVQRAATGPVQPLLHECVAWRAAHVWLAVRDEPDRRAGRDVQLPARGVLPAVAAASAASAAFASAAIAAASLSTSSAASLSTATAASVATTTLTAAALATAAAAAVDSAATTSNATTTLAAASLPTSAVISAHSSARAPSGARVTADAPALPSRRDLCRVRGHDAARAARLGQPDHNPRAAA